MRQINYKALSMLLVLTLSFVWPLPLSALNIPLNTLNTPLSPTKLDEIPPSTVVENAYMVQLANGHFEKRYIQPIENQSVRQSATDGLTALQVSMLASLDTQEVIYVEPIYYLKKEGSPGYQPADIPQADAWRFSATKTNPTWPYYSKGVGAAIGTGSEVVVAIIDDGVHAGIKDLNVGPGTDTADGDSDPTPTSHHGNHVAGIVGATLDNQLGTVGIYPNVRLMPIKVFKNAGSGTTEYLANGINYAVANGADVINLSLSYTGYSAVVKSAIDAAVGSGVMVVAATGNDSKNWPLASGYQEGPDRTQLPVSMSYPAIHQGVVAVGAAQYITKDLNSDGQPDNAVAISDFSNIRGMQVINNVTTTRSIDLIAPGSLITSSYYNASTPDVLTTVKSGTSMATPHVTGLLALLKAKYPTLSSSQLIAAAKNTASTAILTPSYNDPNPPNEAYVASDFIGPGLFQTSEALAYYLPQSLSIDGQNGILTDSLSFTFNPLAEEQTFTLSTNHTAIRFNIQGSQLTSSTVSGVPTTNGLSHWLNVASLPAQFEVITTTTSGHQSTYHIHVVAAAVANANLKSVSFPASGKTLTANQLGQTYRVPYGLSQIYVNTTTEASGANVTISGVSASDSGDGKGRWISLQTGSNTIPIVVTSENAQQIQTYNLTLIKDSELNLGSASLQYLNAQQAVLSTQSFSGANLIKNPNEQTGFFVWPAAASSLKMSAPQESYVVPYQVFTESNNAESASLTPVLGNAFTSAQALSAPRSSFVFRYGFGNQRLRTLLTLDNDSPIDLRLAQISLSQSSLNPAFNAEGLSYSTVVENEVTAITVSANTIDMRAQLTIGDVTVYGGASGSKAVALQVGSNALLLNVVKDSRYYSGDPALRSVQLNLTRNTTPATVPTTTAQTTVAQTTTAQTTSTMIATTTQNIPPPTTSLPSITQPTNEPTTTEPTTNEPTTTKQTTTVQTTNPPVVNFPPSNPPAAGPPPTTTPTTQPTTQPTTTQTTAQTTTIPTTTRSTTPDTPFENRPVTYSSGKVVNQLSISANTIGKIINQGTQAQQTVLLQLSNFTPSSNSQGAQILLDAATSSLIKASSKDLKVVLPNLHISLPNQLFTAGQSIRLDVVSPTSSTSGNGTSNGTQVGTPIQISLFQGNRMLSEFDNPLSIVLTFSDKDLAKSGISNAKQLNAFYWDPYQKQWTYAGGRITGDGQLTFKTRHLSTYSIKAYTVVFNDIYSHWAKNEIQSTGEKNIAQGISPNRFGPNMPLTNAQFITYLARALNLSHTTDIAPFADVKVNKWYSIFVNRAYHSKLLDSVYGNTTKSKLNPDQPITREQMAGLLVNAYSYWINTPKSQLLIKAELTYRDQSLIGSRFKTDVALATQLGLMGGVSGNSFDPKRGATRAEAMVVLLRLIDLLQ